MYCDIKYFSYAWFIPLKLTFQGLNVVLILYLQILCGILEYMTLNFRNNPERNTGNVWVYGGEAGWRGCSLLLMYLEGSWGIKASPTHAAGVSFWRKSRGRGRHADLGG